MHTTEGGSGGRWSENTQQGGTRVMRTEEQCILTLLMLLLPGIKLGHS